MFPFKFGSFCPCRYAQQVAEFFEFVNNKKEAPSEQTSTEKDRMNPKIMFPNKGGLWVPEGVPPFASSAMNLDFRRAMSSYLPT